MWYYAGLLFVVRGSPFRRDSVRHSRHCLTNMADTPDDILFKRQSKQIKALNLQARKEARAMQRADWAARNPDNWRVKGKKP
jgi:hypothetical protein